MIKFKEISIKNYESLHEGSINIEFKSNVDASPELISELISVLTKYEVNNDACCEE